MSDAKFEKAVARVILNEGGYVNDPDDPGGETKYGISKRSYPGLQISTLTVAQAKEIYRKDFWDGPGISRIDNPGVAAKVLDLAVNTGPSRAVKFLQQAANSLGCSLEVDGRIGQKTIEAVNGIRYQKALLASVVIEAGTYYRSLKKPKYLAGWLNRLLDF